MTEEEMEQMVASVGADLTRAFAGSPIVYTLFVIDMPAREIRTASNLPDQETMVGVLRGLLRRLEGEERPEEHHIAVGKKEEQE